MARVLLVEDESLLRETLKIALQNDGHEVVPVSNGAMALKTIEHARFDVVVTDILMPDTDGLETIMRIRKVSNDVRIVAMSGGGRTRNMDMLDHAKSFGADATLAKPFLPKQLLATIHQVLGRTV